MRLSPPVQLAAGAPHEGSSSSGSPGSSGGEPPPAADAKARGASRDAAQKIARALGAAAEDLDAVPPGAAEAKPYTVPPGWKAPTLGEQFRYAAMRHPYYRYGYAAAVVFGIVGWAIATEEKERRGPHAEPAEPAEHGAKGGSGAAG
ncbi:hypothetical protein ABPG75_010056 [Micractinium tetrahymenae]